MFIAMSCWSCSKSLAQHQHRTLTEETPVVAMSHGDSAVVIPQDQFFHTFQQVMDGIDVRVGQPKTQGVGLGGT